MPSRSAAVNAASAAYAAFSPAAQVGLVQAVLERRAIRLAADLHDAAHGLLHQVAAGVARIGAFAAEVGDRGDDHARVPRQQLLRRRAGIGPEVLDHDVAALDQPAQRRTARLRGEVELDAALVPVQVSEHQAALALRAFVQQGRQRAARLAAGRLHLGHLGAEVAEQPRRERPRDALAQVQDTHAFQCRHRHLSSPCFGRLGLHLNLSAACARSGCAVSRWRRRRSGCGEAHDRTASAAGPAIRPSHRAPGSRGPRSARPIRWSTA